MESQKQGAQPNSRHNDKRERGRLCSPMHWDIFCYVLILKRAAELRSRRTRKTTIYVRALSAGLPDVILHWVPCRNISICHPRVTRKSTNQVLVGLSGWKWGISADNEFTIYFPAELSLQKALELLFLNVLSLTKQN